MRNGDQLSLKLFNILIIDLKSKYIEFTFSKESFIKDITTGWH